MKAYLKAQGLKRGFTLVEVAMALGIFSFAIMGLVGLLPVAMQTHQSSKQDTVIAQIVQRLSSEIQLTDYENLGSNSFSYFNQSGLQVTENSANRLYTAQTRIVNSSNLPGYSASSSLKTAQLYVAFDPNRQNYVGDAPVTSLLIGKSDPGTSASNQ